MQWADGSLPCEESVPRGLLYVSCTHCVPSWQTCPELFLYLSSLFLSLKPNSLRLGSNHTGYWLPSTTSVCIFIRAFHHSQLNRAKRHRSLEVRSWFNTFSPILPMYKRGSSDDIISIIPLTAIFLVYTHNLFILKILLNWSKLKDLWMVSFWVVPRLFVAKSSTCNNAQYFLLPAPSTQQRASTLLHMQIVTNLQPLVQSKYACTRGHELMLICYRHDTAWHCVYRLVPATCMCESH